MDISTLTVIDPDAAALVGIPRTPPAHGKTISTDQLADLLALSASRLGILSREGHIPQVSRGRFNRRDAVRAYCEYMRKHPVGRGSSDPAYTAAKTRTAEAQAEKLETANAVARGELIPAAQIEREWAAVLRDVRAAMLALPSRLQQRLSHLSAHDLSVLDREIRDALMEVANAD
jgi:phage terminase Nu1 subunit (DNA packaging protein)